MENNMADLSPQMDAKKSKMATDVTGTRNSSRPEGSMPKCVELGLSKAKSSNFASIINNHRKRFEDVRGKNKSRDVRKKNRSSKDVRASCARSKRTTKENKRTKFEKEKKILEKKVERKYSSGGHERQRSRGPEQMPPKNPDNTSGKPDEKSFKHEYNRRLDCLARYGKNFYYPSMKQRSGLRPIYIDGSNVAFSHGQNEKFSVQGLKICIDYFRKRGHEVKAFIPHFRLRRGQSTDQALLHRLVTKKLVVTTPTLYIKNQRRSPYDDWYIVQSAAANGGVIVSADGFHDIIKWNPNLRAVIEESRLVPTFVDDMLIFPVDPHGNRQNNLEQFLRF